MARFTKISVVLILLAAPLFILHTLLLPNKRLAQPPPTLVVFDSLESKKLRIEDREDAFEDRLDWRGYERASDFHYGEKEMRRKNADTPGGVRLLLNLYCLVSGYGERFGRPLIWAGDGTMTPSLSPGGGRGYR